MKNKRIQLLLISFAILFSLAISAQRIEDDGGLGGGDVVSISGANNVYVNDTRTYYASISGSLPTSGTWTVYGATILSQNYNSATIRWTSSGYKMIEFVGRGNSGGLVEGMYTVNVNAVAAPPVPSTPIVSNQNCSNATLQKSGSSPSGVTWYWQGTNSSGTSTSNSSYNYTVSSTGRYYLRARNSSGIWSTGSSSVYVTMGTVGGSTWYADTDGDGLGDPNTTLVQCTKPSGYVANNSDQCPSSHGGGTASGCPSGAGLSNENYVYTIIPQKEVTSISQLTQTKDAIESVTYYDGLGRPKQSIAIKQSKNEKDIVTHIGYDGFGRQHKEYLPYESTTNDGFIKSGALTATNNYYKTHYSTDINYSNPNPFSEKAYDNSPLNRVTKQSAPGYAWRMGGGHEIEFDYDTNTGNEVRIYNVSLTTNYTPTLIDGTTYYNAGELYKTVTKDENHSGTTKAHTTEEFKDKQGRVILKRTYGTSVVNGSSQTNVAHDTYYVYDAYGNLTYVLPPKSEAHDNKPTTTELNELCYQYKYDKRNRLIEKKIPGKGWEYIVYDKLDRPVLTQDANQRTKSPDEWLLTKYDVFGRVAYTAIYKTNSSRSALQGQYDNKSNVEDNYETKVTSGTGFGGTYYTNSDYPTSIATNDILTVNYYDNYYFNRAGVGTTATSYGVASTNKLKGLATGSRVKVLGTSSWITTVTYYDKKARPIYVYSKNDYLQSSDVVKSKLDFVGKVEETTTLHTKFDDDLPATISTVDKYEYDHAGRLKKHSQKIGSQQEEIIAINTYDNLGQLKSKEVGGKINQSRLQTVDYTYNVRGWLKQINNPTSLGNDLFTFKINYNTVNHGGTKLYNGNISETEWRTKNTDQNLKWYRYNYDALNRITSATDNLNRYSLSSIAYDKNGNITALQRRGHTALSGNTVTNYGLMDNLAYTYQSNSNKLNRVIDYATKNYGFKEPSSTSLDYSYDANGNLISDANKGITQVLYNHLNMPTKVTVTGANAGVLDYVYSADGVKLQKKKTVGGNTTTTDYVGGYVYENNTLKQITHPEGYIERNGNAFQYVYRLTDIWGNTRITFADDNNDGSVTSSEIRREQNYYPFGLEHKGYNSNSYGTENDLKTYQKQEFTKDLDLNVYEWKYRFGDPAIARFWQVDPLAEDYFHNGVYNFSENDPVSGVELEGLEKLSVHVYNVMKENNGSYVAKFAMESTTSGHDWSGTKVQYQYNVYGDDGNVRSIHTGDQAAYSLKKSGIELSSVEGRESTYESVKGAYNYMKNSNDRPAREFRETAKNVVAVASLVVGPELLVERAIAEVAVGLKAVDAVKKGVTVLGKYPDYINLSSKLNARRFNIPTDIWNKMSKSEQWAANVKFLDRTISRGDDIILSNPVKNIDDVTGYFRKELDYLIDKGYKLSDDGTRLVK